MKTRIAKRFGLDPLQTRAQLNSSRAMQKKYCIFCDNELDAKTKHEHILINALGGKKTSQRVICTSHNEEFGNRIDKALAEQVAIIRNMLQLESGTGKPPPMLRKIQSGPDVINIRSDGMPELITKPFTINDRGDGTFDIQITARSAEELNALIPHIAAKLQVAEDQLRDQINMTGIAAAISKQPGSVHLQASLGGWDPESPVFLREGSEAKDWPQLDFSPRLAAPDGT